MPSTLERPSIKTAGFGILFFFALSIWEFPTTRGTLFGGPYSNDRTCYFFRVLH